MNNDKLILKARNHLSSCLRHPLFKIGIAPEEFTRTEKLEIQPVMVRFGCENREDTIDLVLNAKTGDFISMIHTPQKTARDK
jgi:hypothetical protein